MHSMVSERAHALSHPSHVISKLRRKNVLHSDEFSKIREDSEVATIGDYVKLDIMPKMLYVTIFKGISDNALSILTDRLHAHVKTGETKIVLKKKVKKGKFIYSTWLSVKELKHMSKEQLLLRLQKLTDNGRRNVYIIVRQNIARGYIQNLWDEKHSLL
jgi:exopolysaccharide biosynthesis predicted pyruvyltransferase EpsI